MFDILERLTKAPPTRLAQYEAWPGAPPYTRRPASSRVVSAPTLVPTARGGVLLEPMKDLEAPGPPFLVGLRVQSLVLNPGSLVSNTAPGF